MIVAKGSPGWDATYGTRAAARSKNAGTTDVQPDGFQTSLPALREAVIAFRKPVAYVHGDWHHPRIDRPLLDALGRRVENLARVETFGDNQTNGTNDAKWLKVTVNPTNREALSCRPRIVRADRVAVAPIWAIDRSVPPGG